MKANKFIRVPRNKLRAEPADLSFALEVLRRQVTAAAVEDVVPGIPEPDDAPLFTRPRHESDLVP